MYAEPNGSRRSSLRDHSLAADAIHLVIDLDSIARDINLCDPRVVDRVAGKISLKAYIETESTLT